MNLASNADFLKYFQNFTSKNFSSYSIEVDEIRESFGFKDKMRHSFPFLFNISGSDTLISYTSLQYDSMQIFKLAEKDKILVLSSEPNTGKSFALKQIGLKVKKSYSEKWVSYVDLKVQTEF